MAMTSPDMAISLQVQFYRQLPQRFGNKKKDAEDIQFPKGVAFLRDIGCAVTFIQILLMVGFGLACGSEKVMEIAGITTSPWLWIVLQSTVFAGGFLAMNYGLRA